MRIIESRTISLRYRFREWFRKHKPTGPRTAAIVLLIVGIFTAVLRSHIDLPDREIILVSLIDYVFDLSSELTGIGITVLLIDWLYDRHARQEQKATLIRNLNSYIKEVVIRAIEELRARGWLSDGTLSEVKLANSDFEGVNLSYANFEGAFLGGANFKDAVLVGTKFTNAILANANFEGAALTSADLRGASLMRAKLKDALLIGRRAGNTFFDERTSLPDGSFWTPDTDMSKFTSPEHPEFKEYEGPPYLTASPDFYIFKEYENRQRKQY